MNNDKDCQVGQLDNNLIAAFWQLYDNSKSVWQRWNSLTWAGWESGHSFQVKFLCSVLPWYWLRMITCLILGTKAPDPSFLCVCGNASILTTFLPIAICRDLNCTKNLGGFQHCGSKRFYPKAEIRHSDIRLNFLKSVDTQNIECNEKC